METSNIEKNIGKVIGALLKSTETEGEEFINSNQDIIQKFEELRQQYRSNYDFIESLRFLLLPKIAKLICITLNININDDNLMIVENLFKGTYEHFFKYYICKTEGSAFSCDNSYYILGGIIASMIHNKNFSLYDTYRKHPSVKKHAWSKQTYWSPETIKDTDEAFKLFNNWYYLKSNQEEK